MKSDARCVEAPHQQIWLTLPLTRQPLCFDRTGWGKSDIVRLHIEVKNSDKMAFCSEDVAKRPSRPFPPVLLQNLYHKGQSMTINASFLNFS